MAVFDARNRSTVTPPTPWPGLERSASAAPMDAALVPDAPDWEVTLAWRA